MESLINISTIVNAPIEKVWNYWTEPRHITKWYNASDDWHAPYATNDLRVNGSFSTTMAAKDGSMSFDFEGVYSKLEPLKLIEYIIVDGRKVVITFTQDGETTKIEESFEPENIHSEEMQKNGWQSILDNFKKYVEEN